MVSCDRERWWMLENEKLESRVVQWGKVTLSSRIMRKAGVLPSELAAGEEVVQKRQCP